MISFTRISRVWSLRSASASFRLMNFTVSLRLGIKTNSSAFTRRRVRSSSSARSSRLFSFSARTSSGSSKASSSSSARFQNNGAGDGIHSYANASAGPNYAAVYAINTGTSSGLYASSSGGFAAYLDGPVYVSGYLTKAGGGFTIDHPLDPTNKTLTHSFVESPDMMNVYNGNVLLDARGEATVELPEWFEALNRDFRYQLTPIGGPGPSLHVAEEVKGNRFKIAGGSPGLKVSWQVTGIRQDPWANAHRIVVEQAKPADQRGTYLHPEAYGQPRTLATK